MQVKFGGNNRYIELTDNPVVVLSWHCFSAIGVKSSVDGETEECNYQFEAIHEADDYDQGIAGIACPQCKSKLWQGDDYPELVGRYDTIDKAVTENSHLPIEQEG